MDNIFLTYNKYQNNEMENTALNIREAGHEGFLGQKSWGPGNKNFYVIHYVLKGKGFFKCNNKTHRLSKGDTFLICPKDDVFYTPDKYDPWEYLWVSFDGSLVQHFLAHIDFTKDKPYIHYKEDLSIYLKNIIEYEGDTTKSKTYMLGYLYIFFAKLMDDKTKIPEKKDHFQLSYEYILNNFKDKDISVTSIANFVNITRGHLYKIFKDNLNLSPIQFIKKCRIEESLLLLRNTNYTITKISSMTGFKDAYYFSNAFKKDIGCSPTDYRNKFQKK